MDERAMIERTVNGVREVWFEGAGFIQVREKDRCLARHPSLNWICMLPFDHEGEHG